MKAGGNNGKSRGEVALPVVLAASGTSAAVP